MGYTSLSSSQHTHGSPGYNRRAAALFVERTGTWRKRDESGLADDDRIQRWPHSACVWSVCVCVWGGGTCDLSAEQTHFCDNELWANSAMLTRCVLTRHPVMFLSSVIVKSAKHFLNWLFLHWSFKQTHAITQDAQQTDSCCDRVRESGWINIFLTFLSAYY